MPGGNCFGRGINYKKLAEQDVITDGEIRDSELIYSTVEEETKNVVVQNEGKEDKQAFIPPRTFCY